MKFKLYREYGALNSCPVFDAFSRGIGSLGFVEVSDREDVSVIWSVLWKGRMHHNQNVYDSALKSGRPIVIIEVGNLYRGRTWRISLDNINRLGEFGNHADLDPDRPKILGQYLRQRREKRKSHILICSQEQASLQWANMPSMETWVRDTVAKIKSYTDRPILVRPHPRHRLHLIAGDFSLETPQKLSGTYDNFDIDYDCHCVINHNSGPAVQAAISGTPVICDTSSLAFPISGNLAEIENISLPDREYWFLQLCHTEWTVEEIAQGLPLSRLLPKISQRLDLLKR